VRTEVVIVGAGPVGLMLAAELRACAIDVVVLERALEPDARLRAPAITERTIDALARHGLLEPLVGEAQRYRARHGATGPELRADLRIDGTRALPIRQDFVERILERHVRALGADVRRGHELVGLTAHDEGVELRVRGAGGGEDALSADVVVGCDGGRSTVRAAAGIAFPGSDATITGYQAEAEVEDPAALRRGWQRTATGVASYELCPSRVVSIEFGGSPEDRAAPVTLDDVQASLRRTSASAVTLRAARSLTRFTDSARIADAYRRGRVLLAGDAAHVHAPFGGQGMNLGVQDAVNLGWKLAATLRAWASPGLLDGYERERRPVAEDVVRTVQTAVALLDPDDRMTPLYELFGELRQLEQVRRHMHEKTAMVDLRYDVGDDDDVHPVLGRAPRGLTIRTAGGDAELSSLARPGRGLLLILSDAGRPVARAAEPWRDRVDVVVAKAGAAPAGDFEPTDVSELAGLLLRPDGHAVWAGGVDGRLRSTPIEEPLARWFGPPPSTRGAQAAAASRSPFARRRTCADIHEHQRGSTR
jgi:2-polyprenyl-6-methoxyphenol hydroxylase-like FAD-dependent oxidoreductase